jgi:hypothetical protein
LQTLLKCIGIIALWVLPLPQAFAATEEIQVYMDEMDKTGEFGLDVHNNYVFSGNAVPSYPGAQPPYHVYRMTPELSYGLTDNLELGAYMLSSLDANRTANLDGAKLRLKFIAPKTEDQAYFWGANFEIGSLANRVSQNPTGAELKGIYGYRNGPWTFAVNPNIDWVVSGPAAMPATFELDTKVAYAIRQDYSLGFESYNGMGSVNGIVFSNQQIQELFAVVDTAVGGWDLNVGIGRGFSTFSDKWVAKAIIGVPFR